MGDAFEIDGGLDAGSALGGGLVGDVFPGVDAFGGVDDFGGAAAGLFLGGEEGEVGVVGVGVEEDFDLAFAGAVGIEGDGFGALEAAGEAEEEGGEEGGGDGGGTLGGFRGGRYSVV